MKKNIQLLGFVTILSIQCNIVFGQEDAPTIWSGTIVDGISKTAIPHATMASYSKLALYIANSAGQFHLNLSQTDSLRITALGYLSQTINLPQTEKDSTGQLIVRLTPTSYQIKEVTVKGYRGIFDPLIFQNHLPEEELIQLNLPSYIGSRLSKLPPNERSLVGKPSVGAIISPVSLAYSIFSNREKSVRTLAKVKADETRYRHRDMVANKEVIAAISGFENQELDDFIVYCNIHLVIQPFETGASASRKIESLLLKYNEENISTAVE